MDLLVADLGLWLLEVVVVLVEHFVEVESVVLKLVLVQVSVADWGSLRFEVDFAAIV